MAQRIKKAKLYIYKALEPSQKIEKSAPRCEICLDDTQSNFGDERIVTQCGHAYCRSCMETYVQTMIGFLIHCTL